MRIGVVSRQLASFLAVGILFSTGATAEAPEPVSLRDFVDEFAKQESKDIVVDPRVKGSVNLSSELTPGRISAEEFHGVLLTHNFAAYEVDGVMRIIPAAAIKQQKLPFYDGVNRNGLASTQVVTSMIPLRSRPASGLVDHFRPLIGQWGYIRADDHSNSLTVVTTVANVEMLVDLVEKLDQ